MPRPRFLKLSPERRSHIIEAAKTEFAESGFEQASYNRIIDQAGLSKGAMYYYFDDKLDLYVTVLEAVNDEMVEILGMGEDWEPSGEFWAAMTEMGQKGWAFAASHPELTALVKSLQTFPMKARKEGRLGELFDVWRNLLHKLLMHGRSRGEVRSDVPVSMLVEIVVALDEAIDVWLLDHVHELEGDETQVIELVIGFYRRVLAP
jgi:AcrR family transcriptional regulator